MTAQKTRLPGLFTCRGSAYRLLAVVVGLSPLVLFECICMWAGWGEPAYHEDPFVGFASMRPVFVKDEQAGEYRIPQAQYKYFYRESFPLEKRADTFRIFCLGGSTVQGRPFSSETSFTTWLQLSLQAADPDRTYEVINCGGVSYASYRLIPVLEEALEYEPDLIIVYTGHNEFLEDRTYSHIKDRHPLLLRSQAKVAQLRTFNLLRTQYLKLRDQSVEDLIAERPTLNREIQARLDFQDGMDAYHRDPAWTQRMVAHYRYNVARMIRMCEDRGLPVVFVNPVSNLRDTPPFKTEWDQGLTAEESQRFQQLLADSGKQPLHHVAIEKLQQALAIDNQHAGAHFALAKRFDYLGQYADARRAYTSARDYDVCPLRMLESMHVLLRQECQQRNVPLIDAMHAFQLSSDDGIIGSNLLVDHVHPSIAGHQMIAELLTKHLIQSGVVTAQSGWESVRDNSYEMQMDGLDDFYFAKGQERLRRVKEWAAGNATVELPAEE